MSSQSQIHCQLERPDPPYARNTRTTRHGSSSSIQTVSSSSSSSLPYPFHVLEVDRPSSFNQEDEEPPAFVVAELEAQKLRKKQQRRHRLGRSDESTRLSSGARAGQEEEKEVLDRVPLAGAAEVDEEPGGGGGGQRARASSRFSVRSLLGLAAAAAAVPSPSLQHLATQLDFTTEQEEPVLSSSSREEQERAIRATPIILPSSSSSRQSIASDRSGEAKDRPQSAFTEALWTSEAPKLDDGTRSYQVYARPAGGEDQEEKGYLMHIEQQQPFKEPGARRRQRWHNLRQPLAMALMGILLLAVLAGVGVGIWFGIKRSQQGGSQGGGQGMGI